MHPWKPQCYHFVLVGFSLVCPKFSEKTNRQYLWKGLNDFLHFLHAVTCYAFKKRLCHTGEKAQLRFPFYKLISKIDFWCFFIRTFKKVKLFLLLLPQ